MPTPSMEEFGGRVYSCHQVRTVVFMRDKDAVPCLNRVYMRNVLSVEPTPMSVAGRWDRGM